MRAARPGDDRNKAIVKVIAREDLLAIRKYERTRGRLFNRAVSDHFIESMPEDRLLPVRWTMLHNDVEMRCNAYSPDFGRCVMVDMPFEVYDALKRVDRHEHKFVVGATRPT